MADSAIGSLPSASLINSSDLFAIEQNGEAKKLLGSLLTQFVDRNVISVTVTEVEPTQQYTASYDAETGALTIGIPRGVGIASISDPTVSGLDKTYTFTWEKPYSAASATTKSITIKDGDYITGLTAVSAPHTPGELDHYTIDFVERESIDLYVYNGADGVGSPGSATPLMDGTAAVGTATAYSRQDHVHPSDTSRQPVNLYFTEVNASNWTAVSDSESDYIADFPYRGTLACNGTSSTMFAEVIFNAEDAMSGDFAPVCVTGSNVVYIYAASEPSSTVKVETVVVMA